MRDDDDRLLQVGKRHVRTAVERPAQSLANVAHVCFAGSEILVRQSREHRGNFVDRMLHGPRS